MSGLVLSSIATSAVGLLVMITIATAAFGLGFAALRAVLAGGAPSWPSLALAAVLAVADVLLAAVLFARVHRHAVRTGLIARYSAESAS